MSRPFSQRRPDLLAGFWFLAISVALVGPALMVLVTVIDHAAGNGGVFGSFYISPTSARKILGVIAGSLITIASLTSSLTIVTLQLLSSQYSPRAIRGFLRTRLSQVVFGSFIGIFLYCLLLLVVVRRPGDHNAPFVPSLGVVVAIVLALVGLGLLVVFVHRLSQIIQVSTMASRVAASTISAIDEVHPEAYDPSAPDDERRDLTDAQVTDAATIVCASRAGYVRDVHVGALIDLARDAQARVEVLARPGDFVTTHSAVMAVSVSAGPGSALLERAQRQLSIGHERDIDEDPAFGIRLLVDIALRAISPGINDPTTAVTCIHYLQELLEILSERAIPVRVVHTAGAGTVSVDQRAFDEYLEPLTEIARYAIGDSRVTAALLAMLAAATRAAAAAGARERERRLHELVADLARPAVAAAHTDHDRRILTTTLPAVVGDVSPPR